MVVSSSPDILVFISFLSVNSRVPLSPNKGFSISLDDTSGGVAHPLTVGEWRLSG